MSPGRTMYMRACAVRSPSRDSDSGEGALSGSTFCLRKVTVSVGHAFPACLSRMFCSEYFGVRVDCHSPPRRRVRGPAQSGARGGEPLGVFTPPGTTWLPLREVSPDRTVHTHAGSDSNGECSQHRYQAEVRPHRHDAGSQGSQISQRRTSAWRPASTGNITSQPGAAPAAPHKAVAAQCQVGPWCLLSDGLQNLGSSRGRRRNDSNI